ncbi:MAG: DUF488 family protein [Romboutsia sp.]
MNKGTLYTSYFANLRKYKQLNSFNISIERFPRNYLDFKKEGICHWPILAPSKELLNTYKEGAISEDVFREKYIIQLSSNRASVKALNTIRNALDNNINVSLIYYEKSNLFCHIHIIAEIFDELGYTIKEI